MTTKTTIRKQQLQEEQQRGKYPKHRCVFRVISDPGEIFVGVWTLIRSGQTLQVVAL